LVISGLNDGFEKDLLPATKRLLEIDGDPERSHTIRSIVLMKNGRLDEAEKTLREGISKKGETGSLLTNLAKVFTERGDQSNSDETLWRSIQVDPNQENGLLWWSAVQKERGGEAGYLQALHTAAALPGSWRAKLWLARHHLERKEIESARSLYQEVLASGLYDGNTLTMMSGDLGNNGQIPLILELIAPLYDEHKHDTFTGINLLRAYRELGKADEGQALLARMYALGLAPIRQQLNQFAEAFQKMSRDDGQRASIDPDNLKISSIGLTQPIWQYGLRNADWLFAQKPEAAPKIGFFAFSKNVSGEIRAESQREDDIGRLTRAIPLYLTEAVHYWSDYAASCYVMVVEGGGPVISAGPIDENKIFDNLPPEMKYFVTGEIGSPGPGSDEPWMISLVLWDCATRSKISTDNRETTQAALGATVLEMENLLLDRIGFKRTQALDTFYTRPDAEILPIYLTELGQALTLTLLANDIAPKSSLWGERAILDWPLTMALHWPKSEVPKLMYLSGLGKALDYKSDALPEYKERSLQLLRDAENSDSPTKRLSPLVWKIFGITDALEEHIQAQPDDVDSSYSAWLRRVSE
jgi:tetratricopeptide (TPR) repeat protein